MIVNLISLLLLVWLAGMILIVIYK